MSMWLAALLFTPGHAVGPPPPLVSIGKDPPYGAPATKVVVYPLPERLVYGSPTEQAAAAAELEAHPEKVNPFVLLPLVTYLLERGDRARAGFWFYFWQQRSRPWARLGPSDGAAALRASVNATLGPVINEWAGSDTLAMRDLMARAWTYERRVPLFAGRPDNVSEEEWLKVVARERQVNDPEALLREFPSSPEAIARNAELRRRNGLYVGPWEHPGRPIPETWR